jgi:NADPH:quinone reductase-like Zn-dependent oxidoreductase
VTTGSTASDQRTSIPTAARPVQALMSAVTQHEYGAPEVLRVAEVDRPEAGDDQVLVRVHAAGLDRGVWHLVTGLPFLVRLAGYGLRRPKAVVPGSDVAGRVEAVGSYVTRFAIGDAVFGTCRGAFAEYASADAGQLAPKPANLTFEQAAAVPVSAQAALQGLRDVGRVRAGQRVLVIGAAGGVGTFAVQIAKGLGAEVTGVCSTAKLDLVRSLGADHVLDYTREDVARTDRRFDVVLDIAGNRSLRLLRRLLAPDGTLVIVGGEGGGRWIGGTDRQLRALALSPFTRQTLRAFVSKSRSEDLEHLRELIENGTVTPVVDRIYPLSGTPGAIRDLVEGRIAGKAVITLGPPDEGAREPH